MLKSLPELLQCFQMQQSVSAGGNLPNEPTLGQTLLDRVRFLQQVSTSAGAAITPEQARYAAQVSLAPLGIACYYVTAMRILAYADWSIASPNLRHIRQKVLCAVARGWTCAMLTRPPSTKCSPSMNLPHLGT